MKFARLFLRVVYASYVGVAVRLYCISDGLRDCAYEDRTAVACPTEPLGKVVRLTGRPGPRKLRRHVGAIMSERIDVDRRRRTAAAGGRDRVEYTRSAALMDRRRPQGACLRHRDDVTHLDDDDVACVVRLRT